MIPPSERHSAQRHVTTSIVALACLVTENVFDNDPPRIAAGTGGRHCSGRYFRAGGRFKI